MAMPDVQQILEDLRDTLEELRVKHAAALAVIVRYPPIAAEVYAAMESAVPDAEAAAAMQAQTNALRSLIDYSGAVLREAAAQYESEPEPEPESEPETDPEPEGS